jgi:signal transduction histidine kinase
MVFRMAAGYVALLLLSVTLIAGVFYVGTAGLLRKNIDEQLRSRERQLVQEQRQHGMGGLVASIHELLTDDQDSDTEIYLLLDAAGHRIIGNLTTWPAQAVATDGFHQGELERLQRPASALLLTHRFTGGETLVVGRDVQDVRMLEHRIMMAFVVGGLLAVLLSAGGALLFRSQLQRQLKAIHRTTTEVAAGRLGQRIAIGRSRDEFAIVAHDVNTMLDEIERLMGDARQVSDAIAHDLRTPLTRMRTRLYRLQQQFEGRPEAAQLDDCVAEIDTVLARFRALLRVSELEDRQRSACFERMDLGLVLRDVYDFYAPVAEDRRQVFELDIGPLPSLRGDRQLMFEALANLVGNAIKFTPDGGAIHLVALTASTGDARIDVADTGPGIPPDEREAVFRRFYRSDDTRSKPGCGLGLAIVSAIVRLHGYSLSVGGNERGAVFSVTCPAA